jgi:hypothetical protein
LIIYCLNCNHFVRMENYVLMQYSVHCMTRHSWCNGISSCWLLRTSDKSLTHSFDVLRSLSEGSLPGGFLFAADAVFLKFLTHNSTVLRLGTLSFRWMLKCWWNILW